VLNVSSTGCNNEQQSFVKLSYSAIDNNVLTNLPPAGFIIIITLIPFKMTMIKHKYSLQI